MKKQELDNIKAEMLKKVGKNIQLIREDKSLSQFDLTAKMMGEFDVTNVSRLESGRNNPTLFTLFRIAEALEVPMKDLLNVD